MKYFNKNHFILIALISILCTNCKKDYLDINNDPNRATDINTTPELLFTQSADLSGGQIIIPTTAYLNRWVGYFAATGDFARDQTETSYDIDFSFSNATWSAYYNALFDLHLVKTKSLVEGGDTVLAAASMILSVKLFQEVVDIFGDIPYSQAFQETNFSTPAYDKAEDIYKSLQLSLDTAISLMKQDAPVSFASVDVVNHGDQTKWIKFANTLKLRLLIRQSEVSGFNPSTEITKIQANGGVLKAGETVSVNPGYTNQLNKQSPFYATFGYTPTYNKATTSTNPNNFFINLLESTADPREDQFFQPTSSGFIGSTYGDESGNNPTGAQSSYFGPGLIGLSDLSGKFVEGASQSQWIYPSFESMFLEAEAISRGWITNDGDARTAYENAVIESFVWLKATNAVDTAKSYLINTDIANWDNSGSTVNDKAKFIAFQKYIALCGIDPLEAWSDIRRLHMISDNGYISANPSRISDMLPVRLLYPQTEYTTNATNVKAIGNINQFSSKIFWEP